uniref:Uncharacterized protein n=1 Tax=Panagrolaimus superbus TaxID=310955 RepID=A0A914XZD3_9BILA
MARNLKKEYKKKKGANKDASASPPKPQPMKTSVKGRKQVDGGGEDIMASEPSLLEEVADVSSVALKNIEDKGAVDSPAEIRRKLALRIHKLRDVYPAVIDVSNLGSLIVKNEEGKFLDFEKFTCGLEKSLVDIFRDDNKITVVSDAQEKKVLSITRGEVPLKDEDFLRCK